MNGSVNILDICLATLLVGISATWTYFVLYMFKSLRKSPYLENVVGSFDASKLPSVSVILPARNEQNYIGKCLNSLLGQNYPNFEIIVINDSSNDGTEEIVKQYQAKYSKIILIDAGPKPLGWAGKNWACYQGYLNAKGVIFLFTDADTFHHPDSMRLAVEQMLSEGLDAITAIPRLLCNDFWTKITIPMLSTFLHTRFSALRVNDKKTKTGYFFGSFFAITRATYESVGTHMGVKEELVEDGALGAKVKEQKFALKMVRGEKYIQAIWARDLSTLWHGLRRLMIPIYFQDSSNALLMVIAIFFILFAPFPMLPYSIVHSIDGQLLGMALLILNSSSVSLIFVTCAIQSRVSLFQSPVFAIASPVSGAIISFCFISSIIDAKRSGNVSWRGRSYSISEKQHPIS